MRLRTSSQRSPEDSPAKGSTGASLNLLRPCRLDRGGVLGRLVVEARDQFGSDTGPLLRRQRQGFAKKCFRSLTHVAILGRAPPPNKPAARKRDRGKTASGAPFVEPFSSTPGAPCLLFTWCQGVVVRAARRVESSVLSESTVLGLCPRSAPNRLRPDRLPDRLLSPTDPMLC